jgi:hypothetical protein
LGDNAGESLLHHIALNCLGALFIATTIQYSGLIETRTCQQMLVDKSRFGKEYR